DATSDTTIVVREGESFDFSTLDCESPYQIIGLAYDGPEELTDAEVIAGAFEFESPEVAGCFSLSENVIEVNVPDNLREGEGPGEDDLLFQASELTIRPNPAVNYLQLQYELPRTSSGTIRLEVFDITGRPLFSRQFESRGGLNEHQLDITGLGAGMYVLRISQGSKTISRRFVKGRR
ncbi:MAG: T9SS type A sorting domain-containing protein, partial [Saprospiraceae bacterium]|nr:T9SS type A sorting domain-containing protein [Saprospiraceae bacterium]